MKSSQETDRGYSNKKNTATEPIWGKKQNRQNLNETETFTSLLKILHSAYR